MIIGVPKEIKTEEYRVGMTPAGVAELAERKHTVLIEEGAGEGVGFSSKAYEEAGARIVSRDAAWAEPDLVVKVKEPIPSEYDSLRPDGTLFTFLHLAPNPELAKVLLEKNITGLAYETLEVDGILPLLRPMSEIAGRIAPLAGANFLQKAFGGTGVLPMGATGVRPGRAVIFGAGVAGSNAARFALGLGFDTTVVNIRSEGLGRIDELFGGRIRTLPLNREIIETQIASADLVIGAVLVPGGRTPVLIPRKLLSTMKRGAVIVDISVDQGGCVETTRPTTHAHPVYTVDGVIHYAVANMPGAFPHTSTLALTNATMPWILRLADAGTDRVLEEKRFRSALNTFRGEIVHEQVARDLGVNLAP